MSKLNKKKIQFIAFLNGISEDVSANEEVASEYLKEKGKDPEQIGQDTQQLVQKLYMKKQRLESKAEKENLLIQAKKLLHEAVKSHGNIEDPKKYLLKVLGRRTDQQIGALWNNIDDLSTEEAIEVLNDHQLLDLINDLKEGDD